jgi:signal peptidase I
VVLGFLLNGSAHFLSGSKAAGLKWYFGLFACGVAAIVFVATPGMLPLVLGLGFLVVNIALWLVMLKQSYRPVRRIGVTGWLAVIVLALVLNNGMRYIVLQVVRPFRVPTGAMSPTIIPGDHLFIERLPCWFGSPERGDIVVFRTRGIEGVPQDTYYIKRVAGLPGERIRIEPPFLVVNGRKVTQPEIFSSMADGSGGSAGFRLAVPGTPIGGILTAPDDEIALGPNKYFVLGDNTVNSYDSRYWGAISGSSIIGKATRIYWPFARMSALDKE